MKDFQKKLIKKGEMYVEIKINAEEIFKKIENKSSVYRKISKYMKEIQGKTLRAYTKKMLKNEIAVYLEDGTILIIPEKVINKVYNDKRIGKYKCGYCNNVSSDSQKCDFCGINKRMTILKSKPIKGYDIIYKGNEKSDIKKDKGPMAAIGKIVYGNLKDDGSNVKFILVSNNGNMNYTGAMLKACYNAPSKIDRLIALGDLKVLGERVTKKTDAKETKVKMQSVCKPWQKENKKIRWAKELEFFRNSNIDLLRNIQFAYFYDEYCSDWITYRIKVTRENKVFAEPIYLSYLYAVEDLMKRGLIIKPNKEFFEKEKAKKSW